MDGPVVCNFGAGLIENFLGVIGANISSIYYSIYTVYVQYM